MLAALLGDEGAEQGLALVEGKQVLEDLHRAFVDGVGFDEDVEDGGKELGGEDGAVDLDGG
jgi:hypothetical protein